MNDSIWTKYQKYYQKKGGNDEKVNASTITVEVIEGDLYRDDAYTSSSVSNQIDSDSEDDVRREIKHLLAQESHIRNQREKYRMNYYKLEASNADQEEFKQNYHIIKSLTDQLAPLYIRRKKIEETGKVYFEKKISTEDEIKLAKLKYDKRRLIDKKSKLDKKVKTYLSFAKGQQNLPRWEAELAAVNLDIYELDIEIKKIEE